MAINGIGGAGFNPYATGVNVTRGGNVGNAALQRPIAEQPATTNTGATPQSVAEAIQNDAAARAAQVNSPHAPDGVDQELWSVLTKDERSFFVKAGAMGPLTYGRFQQSQQSASAPIIRGGRLDIKA